MRIVITRLIASCCFGHSQRNAAATGTGGDSALKRKAKPHTVSALALDRRLARDTRAATAGIIELGGVCDDAARQSDKQTPNYGAIRIARVWSHAKDFRKIRLAVGSIAPRDARRSRGWAVGPADGQSGNVRLGGPLQDCDTEWDWQYEHH